MTRKMKSVSPALRKKLVGEIVKSPTYLRAYHDRKFMGRDELRPFRLEIELLKPEMTLTEQDVRSTVVVFGSARLKPLKEAEKYIRDLERLLRRKPKSRILKARLAAAHNLLRRSKNYDEARRFAALVTKASKADKNRNFVIVTGGGPGVMEAANRGAWEAGGKSIGLNITLPHEQIPNPFVTPELCFRFHYFAMRKMHFMMRARAMVAFPGGFGTFDELFEALTLVQTTKKHRIPILLFDREYWTRVVDFEYLAQEGMISPEHLDLIRYVETAEEAWKAIRDYWKRSGYLRRPPKRRSIVSGHVDECPPLS